MELLLEDLSAGDVSSLACSSKFDSIFALPAFLELMARADMKTHFYIGITDRSGSIYLVAPVMFSRLRPGIRLASCPAPPQIIEGSERAGKAWRNICEALVRHLKHHHKCVSVSIDQRPHDPRFIKGTLERCRFSYNHDISVDLSDDLRTIYSGMDKRHRYTLRKVSGCSDNDLLSDDWIYKSNFTIKQGTTEQDLREFRTLWTKTLRRMRESFSFSKRFLYRDPLAYSNLKTVLSRLSPYGLVELFTVYDENGQPGSSAIFYLSKNLTKMPIAYWSSGASSEEGREKGLNVVLQWYVMQWLKSQSYQAYYMGGFEAQNPNDGPSLFKKGFGGRIASGLTATWLTRPLSLLNSLTSNAVSMISTIKGVF